MEKIFRLKENNTNVRTEVTAGLTTFMTMAYILAVNPAILGTTGMNTNGILIATSIASLIGCFLMGFMANLPIALSSAMGLNAFFAYTVVANMGVPWQTALFAVFCEGVIFIILSLTTVREAIFNAIPVSLKKGVSVGIGLFIAFIGLQNAGLMCAAGGYWSVHYSNSVDKKCEGLDTHRNSGNMGAGYALSAHGALYS